ncbi:MAG: hypothetical protein AAF664_20345 [Planctomycetota bacterium]
MSIRGAPHLTMANLFAFLFNFGGRLMNVGVTKTLGMIAIFAIAMLSDRCLDAAELSSSQIDSPSHRQIRVIKAQVDGNPTTLHSLISDANGRLLIAVGGQQSYQSMMMSGESTPTKQDGHILQIDAEGNELARWTFDMTPSAVTVSPDGKIFVGGSGKVVMLDDKGGIAKEVASPHIGDRETFAKRTIEAQQRLMRSFLSEENLEPLREMVEQLEETPEDDRSNIENAQLNAVKMQLEQMEAMMGENEEKEDDELEIDPMMEMQIEHAMSVTSIASSKDYIFVCASDPSNGGYSVWRLDQDLDPDSTEVVMSDLRGCCGQMDIQCCDEKLIVSENSAFRVGVYDLEGELVSNFGSQDRTSKQGFGSCCNPMNTLSLGDGTILAAESSIGHIKHFDLDGNLIAYVGKARIGGGCKHCAMAYDSENDLYFMQSEDNNEICVMGRIDQFPTTDSERMLAQRQKNFLKTFAGTWSKDGKAASGGLGSFFGVFSGSETSDEDSMYPMTSWTINENGSTKINSGQYAGFMDNATIELLPTEEGDSENTHRVSILEEQVAYIDATLVIKGDSMAIDFGQDMNLTLVKVGSSKTANKTEVETVATTTSNDMADVEVGGIASALEGLFDESNTATTASGGPICDGDNCEDGACATAKEVAVTHSGMSPLDAFMMESESDVVAFQPEFEYKLISMKELGDEREASLNELGADGWEYCEKLGRQLMFKRIKGVR